jgi:hypothetical protein
MGSQCASAIIQESSDLVIECSEKEAYEASCESESGQSGKAQSVPPSLGVEVSTTCSDGSQEAFDVNEAFADGGKIEGSRISTNNAEEGTLSASAAQNLQMKGCDDASEADLHADRRLHKRESEEAAIEKYLPQKVNGVVVMEEMTNGEWRATDQYLGSAAQGLGYRRSKNLDDRFGGTDYLQWGQSIAAIDTGDDWLLLRIHSQAREPDTCTADTELVQTALQTYEQQDDLFGAWQQLREIRRRLKAQPVGIAAWNSILHMEALSQLRADLRMLQELARECYQDEKWCNVYTSADGKQRLDVSFDDDKPSQIHYRTCLDLPVKLTNAMAIGNEMELMKLWNPYLVEAPGLVCRNGGFKMIVASKISLLAGMLKNEALDDVRRYVDEEAGIVSERICSVAEGHPMYRAPSRGYKRTETSVKSVWIACGSQRTKFLQVGQLDLPISMNRRLIRSLGSLAGKYVMDSFCKTATQSTKSGSPWEDALANDIHGFYARLDRCVQSEASKKREAAGPATCNSSDVASVFERLQLD